MKALICVDIDNVIAQTDEIIRELIKLHSKDGVDLSYTDIVAFDYWRCADAKGRQLDRMEWAAIHLEFTRYHLSRIRPVDDVATHLGRLAHRCEIHLVTSRLSIGEEGTRQWLLKHCIPFDHLHFVEHRRKHEIDLPFAVAIDDDREQAVLFHERGVRAVLLAHPWNEVDPGSPVTRVEGWPRLVSTVLGLAR